MNKLFLLLLVFALISCSSTSKKESTQVDDEISNTDFKNVKPINFDIENDNFEKIKDDVLSSESLARVDKFQLDEYETKNDPIGRMAGQCYKGQFHKAMNIADQIYRKYKKHPGYWTQIGNCYFREKDYLKSLLYYNKAIDLNKKYAPPVNNLGVIHQIQGRDSKALAAYREAAALNKDSLTPIFNLAHLYLKYGLVDDASVYFNALARRNDKDVDVLLGLASIALFKGDTKRSVKIFSRIPRYHRSRIDIGLNYAVALKVNGDEKSAKRLFKDVNPNNLGDYKMYYERVKEFVGEL